MLKYRLLFPLFLPLTWVLLLPYLSPDAPWGLVKFAGVLLSCAVSAAACMGIGYAAAVRLKIDRPLLFAAPFGALLLSLLFSLLGLGGVIGPRCWWIYAALMLVGLSQFPGEEIFRARRWVWLPFLLVAALALIPNEHPDPLYYHLLGARYWYDQGRILFNPDHPLLFLSGLWDAIFLWPISWLRLLPGEELISQQIVSQVLVAAVAFGGSVALLREAGKKLWPKNPEALLFFALASPLLLPVAFIAKNDWGIVLWLCAAVFLLDRKLFLLAGIFAGAAISTKWTAGFFLLWLIACIWRHPRAVFLLCAGAALGAVIIMGRNFAFTGAPFFPHLAHGFLSISDQAVFTDLARGHGFANNLWRFFCDQPLNFALLLLPVVWHQRKDQRAQIALWFGLLALSTIFFAAILHPALSWRVTVPLPILWCIASGWLLLSMAEQFGLPRKVEIAAAMAVFLVSLAPQFPLLLNLFQQPAQTIRSFAAGDAMAFLRLRGDSFPIAVGGNPQLFYLSGFKAVMPETVPELDALVRTARKPSELALALEQKGFRWFVETAGPIPLGRSSSLMSTLAEAYPEAIAFRGAQGRVVDLPKLIAIVHRADFHEPAYEDYEPLLEQQK